MNSQNQQATREDIIALYQSILKRRPESEAAINYYLDQSFSGKQIENILLSSEEYKEIKASVELEKIKQLHVDYFIKRFNANNKVPEFLWVLKNRANDPIMDAAMQNRFEGAQIDLLNIFKKPKTILDIGANLGAFALAFASCGSKVFAIEASIANVDCLNLSKTLNHFDIEILPTAVFQFTGKIYFCQAGPFGFIKDAIHDDADYEEISCICLDEFEKTALNSLTSLDLIKMDIEGSEVAALKGMKKFLSRFDYPPIFCESNLWTLFMQQETQASLFLEFSSMGYQSYKIQDEKIYEYPMDELQDEICTDFLFMKDIPESILDKVAGPFHSVPKQQLIEKLSMLMQQNEVNKLSILYNLQNHHNLLENTQLKKYFDRQDEKNDEWFNKATSWLETCGEID